MPYVCVGPNSSISIAGGAGPLCGEDYGRLGEVGLPARFAAPLMPHRGRGSSLFRVGGSVPIHAAAKKAWWWFLLSGRET